MITERHIRFAVQLSVDGHPAVMQELIIHPTLLTAHINRGTATAISAGQNILIIIGAKVATKLMHRDWQQGPDQLEDVRLPLRQDSHVLLIRQEQDIYLHGTLYPK